MFAQISLFLHVFLSTTAHCHPSLHGPPHCIHQQILQPLASVFRPVSFLADDPCYKHYLNQTDISTAPNSKNAVIDVSLLDHHMSVCSVEVVSAAFGGVYNFY